MPTVEQAIFTSAQTSSSVGYQLVVHSPGIDENDLRELSAWGPSHDSLWEPGSAAMSVNFHRLQSGAYCVSRTIAAGGEFSQRRGPQLYTQQLVASAETMAQFANNPFDLLQAAIAQGHVEVLTKFPKQLPPLALTEAASDLTATPLAQLVAEGLPALVQSALHSRTLGLVAGEQGPRLMAGLFSVLPVELRLGLTFTTGLRFSPRRPFRLVCLPPNRAENQRYARQYEITLLDLSEKTSKSGTSTIPQLTGWAALVAVCGEQSKVSLLADELLRARPGLTPAALDEVGERLLLEINATAAVREATPQTVAVRIAGDDLPEEFEPVGPAAASRLSPWQRADEQHARGRAISPALDSQGVRSGEVQLLRETIRLEEEPAAALAARCPQAAESLERLEDLIFESLAGKSAAQEQLKPLWQQSIAVLGPAHLEMAREHYLRFALALWRQLTSRGDLDDPQRGAHAMEVICVLFDR